MKYAKVDYNLNTLKTSAVLSHYPDPVPDPITPQYLYPVFADVLQGLLQGGHLDRFRVLGGQLLVSLDGTSYLGRTGFSLPQPVAIRPVGLSLYFQTRPSGPFASSPPLGPLAALALGNHQAALGLFFVHSSPFAALISIYRLWINFFVLTIKAQ